MKLYARRTSSNSQKVLWFLAELGVDYEFVAAGGDAGGLRTPEYLAMNPNGAVPTLLHGDFAVWESHAILRYLAAGCAPERFWSSDPRARSWIERWMDWSQSQFDSAFMELFWGYWRMPEADRDPAANERQVKRCRRYLKVMDEALTGKTYLVDDQLSLADIAPGALMYRYVNLDITEELPVNVARWYAALSERVPFQTHIMLPFDELKGRLAP
jgi:glutathione S-transferase